MGDPSGKPSHTLELPLTVKPDFSVSSATPSQTVPAGPTERRLSTDHAPNSQRFSFGGAVTLSCPQGLPAGAQCRLTPPTPQTPENSAVNVVMTISTSAAASNWQWPSSHRSIFFALWLFLPGIVIGWGAMGRISRKVKIGGLASPAMVLPLTWSLLNCGGVSTGGGSGGGGNTPLLR